MPQKKALVSIIMGSDSDWQVMKKASDILQEFKVAHEVKVVSAHRTAQAMQDYALKVQSRGIKVIIAGAAGAAHLPGMVASLTTLPVIGVPVMSKQLKGLDSLLSIAQMPRGVPVATVAVDNAHNAALLATRMLAISQPTLTKKLINNIKQQQKKTRQAQKNIQQFQKESKKKLFTKTKKI